MLARSIQLWTNPGDVVFDPFAGIGSGLYQAVKMGRRGMGIELKRNYLNIAAQYLRDLETQIAQPTLFDLMAQAEERFYDGSK